MIPRVESRFVLKTYGLGDCGPKKINFCWQIFQILENAVFHFQVTSLKSFLSRGPSFAIYVPVGVGTSFLLVGPKKSAIYPLKQSRLKDFFIFGVTALLDNSSLPSVVTMSCLC